MNPSLMTAWMVEVVIISYRALKTGSGAGTGGHQNVQLNTALPLPLPSEYLSTFIVYGALGLVPGRGARVASYIGWGFVVATLLNLWTPGKANQKAPGTVASTAGNQSPSLNKDTGVPQTGA